MLKLALDMGGCGAHVDFFRQLIKSAENKYELTQRTYEADVIVYYMCCFSDMKVDEILYELKLLEKTKKKGAKLILCGCATRLYSKEFFDVDFVDHVVTGIDIIEELAQIMGIEASKEYALDEKSGEFSINITDGCVKPGGPCEFCKLKAMREPFRSKFSIEEICEMVRKYKKPILTLTGLNTTNYGIDFGDKKPKLHTLIREVSKIETVKWIRIDAIASSCIYKELLEELKRNPKVVAVQYFIQSGSDRMLSAMNVGSSVEKNIRVLRELEGKAIESNVIVGFPGEEDEDVRRTVEYLKENGLWYVTVTPFETTMALHDGLLPKDVFQKHCDTVRKAVEEMAYEKLSKMSELTGYVEELHPEGERIRIIVRPLGFDSISYVFSKEANVKPGAKVRLHDLQIRDLRNRELEGKWLEVVE